MSPDGLMTFIRVKAEPPWQPSSMDQQARWVRAHIPTRQRLTFLGTILFRTEGGAVRKRLRWKTADELRRMVDVECNGAQCRDATEILQLMKADIPALNNVRFKLFGGRQHV